MAMLIMGLLALTSVYAHPIHEASSNTGEKSTHALERRDPVRCLSESCLETHSNLIIL